MKKIKRILSLVLAFMLALNVTCYAATEAETSAANQLNAFGILKGRDNGGTVDLALGSTITRAEIATLVLRITGQEETNVPNLETVTQKDIVGHWAETNIRKVIKLGYMKGYDDNSYGPNDNITYQEVVTLVLRLIGEEKNLTAEWPIGQIEKAKSIGLVKGETVFPKDRYPEKLTRGTVALILYDTMILGTNTF
ncbi:MAG: S-layer homology domain-containing protein [Clostridia bacterium]|nr:S-layer homology domain-containing protein [Clostridia bacterium]